MLDRRTFITRSAAVVGAASLCSTASAKPKRSNLSGVVGYNYRLPILKKGCRLLFQGDSITDM